MSREKQKRSTAMTWIHEFIQLAGDRLIFFFSDMLSAILHCISDPVSVSLVIQRCAFK